MENVFFEKFFQKKILREQAHFDVSYFLRIMYNENETLVTNYDMSKGRKNNEAQNENPAACGSDRGTLQLYAADRDDENEREKRNSKRRQPDLRGNRITEQGLYLR